jgi:hypothetical protein
MNIDTATTPQVLIAPAWRKWGSANSVKLGMIILHAEQDDVIPITDSRALIAASGLCYTALVVAGRDHNMVDEEALGMLLTAIARLVGDPKSGLSG